MLEVVGQDTGDQPEPAGLSGQHQGGYRGELITEMIRYENTRVAEILCLSNLFDPCAPRRSAVEHDAEPEETTWRHHSPPRQRVLPLRCEAPSLRGSAHGPSEPTLLVGWERQLFELQGD